MSNKISDVQVTNYCRHPHIESFSTTSARCLDCGEWLSSPDTNAVEDVVNHPSHYTRFKGIEVIQLTEQLNFCRGNAVKYIARAGAKDPAMEIQDLEKAVWYIQREIERIKSDANL
jgi:hypothetical protein